MNQESLFSKLSNSPQSYKDGHAQVVRFAPDFAGWQAAARAQLTAQSTPDSIWWHADADAPTPEITADIRVPRAYVDQARAAACHRNSDRWALLYSVLWRLTHGERHLLSLGGDPEVACLHRYAKAVRRDVHKMKAFVRFRHVPEPDAADQEGRYVAWFEPEHYIVEYSGGFFKRRFANMRWSILTPQRCMHWEGSGQLWFSNGVDKSAAPQGDELEQAWRTYYRNIFNPARLKIRAMQSEMPQKYWKNLPEASVINELLRDANRRVHHMQVNVKTSDDLHCGPRPQSPAQTLAAQTTTAPTGSLEQLALRAEGCRNCELWKHTTQTVFGQGPSHARVMLIGGQPGDKEDLTGKPFVGPAGQLLDRALAEAGVDRESLYVTYALKHFKFAAHGKQRLPASPSAAEVSVCLPWLHGEIARVNPELVICLGATAARTQLGHNFDIAQNRGKLIEQNGRLWLASVHPAQLLEMQDKASATCEYQRFVADLALARDKAGH